MFVGGAYENADGSPVSADAVAASLSADAVIDDGRAKCRHDWYQTPTHMIVSIYAKKVDPAVVRVNFQSKHVDRYAYLLFVICEYNELCVFSSYPCRLLCRMENHLIWKRIYSKKLMSNKANSR